MTYAHGVPVFCECGDQLIHQNHRGASESSSLLGQHVHDRYPRDFDWLDVDGCAWKRSTGRLIIIEHKYPGQSVRGSQERVLPLWGELIRLGIDARLINSGGAYLMYGQPPFDTACVTQWPGRETFDLDHAQVDDLLQCKPIRGTVRR